MFFNATCRDVPYQSRASFLNLRFWRLSTPSKTLNASCQTVRKPSKSNQIGLNPVLTKPNQGVSPFWSGLLRTRPFADGLLGISQMSQPELLLPHESSICPEHPLRHLRISSYLQAAPAQTEIKSRAAKDAVKRRSPAAVVKRTSLPPRITFTRSD
jgi:hypothetical protein